MRRWGAALIVFATAGPCLAYDAETAAALTKRVVVEPEDEFKDPLDDSPDEFAVARIVGRLTLPHIGSSLGAAAAELLERVATNTYDHALDGYLQLLQNDAESKLAFAPEFDPLASGMTSRDFHAVVQERLRCLPPATLAKYRKEVDADAARLLADGTAQRDPVPLRKLVRDYRASSHADAALALLGDLAFERGDFDQAFDWWRRIAPLPWRGPSPREAVDLPRIAAKQVLALIFAGRREAAREIDAYRERFPSDRGSLAGRDGPYQQTLSHWLDRLRTTKDADDALDRSWPTFAGAGSRNRVVGKSPSPRLWLDGPAWKRTLPTIDVKEPPPVWVSATRSLAVPHSPIHPTIADGQVLISDGQSVYSFDLLTGKPRFRSPMPEFEFKHDGDPAARPAFSVSAGQGRAVARLSRRLGDPQPKTLVCVDLRDAGKILWQRAAEAGHYDADPLVVGERVFVSETTRDETSSTRWLSCIDLDGPMQWRAKLAVIRDVNDKSPRPGLLVDAGSVIVDATEAGVVVAVDPGTGRRMWAFRYPVLDAAMSPRGSSSCLAADGRIYLAPADSPNLYCLDAETGRTIWERPWTKGPSDIIAAPPRVSEVIDLLGVVDDRLIFTDRYRLQALDARTGARLDWQQPRMGKLPSHGRGLLAGPWVFWPTADPEVNWRAVTQSDGHLRAENSEPAYYEPTIVRGLPPGNSAYAQGCLAIAGPRELVVYVPAAEQLPVLQADPQAKSSPAKLYRLAAALHDAGQTDRAKATFAKLERTRPAVDARPWQAMFSERTGPASVAPPRPSQTLKTMVPAPVRAAATTAAFNKLVPAWGPIAGAAPPIERAPSTRAEDIAVVVDGDEFAFVAAATGVEQFRQRGRTFPTCRHGQPLEWIGRAGDVVMLAGPSGIEAFDVETRRPVWRFDAPALKAAHWRLVNETPQHVVETPRLNGFHFAHDAIAFFEDRRRVLALDPQNGSLLTEAWLDPVGALGIDGTLQPPLEWIGFAGKPNVPMLMSVDLDAAGEEVDETEGRRRFARLDGTTWAVGQSHGAVRVRRSDRQGNVTNEIYQPNFRMSLTGAAAHVMGDASVCFALVPRNQGFELIRFARPESRQPLRPMWTLPPFELRDGFDVLAARWDDRALYFVHAGQLQARSLADGSLLWKRDLPKTPGPWKLERFGGGLIAWPQSHAGLPALSGPVDPFTAAWTLLHGRRGIGNVPIEFLDAKTGALKQRLDVPHDRGPVFVNVAGPRIIVTAGGAVRAWTGTP